MGSKAEKKYNAAKALQAIGYNPKRASEALGVSTMTIGRYYRAASFEDYKNANRQYKEKLEARKAEKELKASLTPATDLPIFQAAEAIAEAQKKNEIVMSRLELLGTPHEISLLAQVARKMGVIGKYTANAK
jgi:DNA-binding MurR/RpiR family transcriptional regulator